MFFQKEEVDSAFYWFQKSNDCFHDIEEPGKMAMNFLCMGILEYHDRDNSLGSAPYFKQARDLGLIANEETQFVLASEYLIDILAGAKADTINYYLESMNAFQQERLSTGAIARRAILNDTQFEAITAKVELEQSQRESAELKANRLLWIALGVGFMALAVVWIAVVRIRRQNEKRAAAELEAQQAEEINQRKVSELLSRHKYESLVAGIKGEEQERERIAQELHDNIGGSLGIIAAQLGGDVDLPAEESHRLGSQLNSIYKDLRSLSHTLQLPEISTNALVELTHSLLVNLGKASGVETSLKVFPSEAPLDLPDHVEVQLYRILQELCNNTLKHADAKVLEVSITRRPDAVVMMVEDDGKGFDPIAKDGGAGLGNMYNRASGLGGHLEIDSAVGRGSIFTVEVPLSES